MKKLIILGVIPALLLGCSPKNKIPDGYKLFFEDEFDGDKLSSNWSYEIGNGNSGWGNHEVEYYQKENAVVKDGSCILLLKKKKSVTSTIHQRELKPRIE